MKKILLALLILLPAFVHAQIITTVVGTGVGGFSGDGGPATAAQINQPTMVTSDISGRLYICDYVNNCIRKVDALGIMSTIAGTTIAGYSGDGGPATAAQLNKPVGIFVDNYGNVYVSDGGPNNCIRKINSSGIITTIAGTGTWGYSGDGGAATNALMYGPARFFVDGAGNIYIPEIANHCIRKVSSTGIISTIAGTTVGGYSGDGGLATAAQLNGPRSVVVDASGNIIFTDAYNNRIRKINSSGYISTVAGITTPGFSGDGGPATLAKLNYPDGLFIDDCGNIIFTDAGNQRVRFINTSGVINTIAGIGTVGFSGDGGPATAAELHSPSSIFSNAVGELYLSDARNHRIRKFSFGCKTTDIYSLEKNNRVNIYPNPTTTLITISAEDKISTIAISNLIGQTVYTQQLQARQVQVDVSGLPMGMYLIRINDTEVRKFVKQ